MKLPWSDIRTVLSLKNILYMATWSVVGQLVDTLLTKIKKWLGKNEQI